MTKGVIDQRNNDFGEGEEVIEKPSPREGEGEWDPEQLELEGRVADGNRDIRSRMKLGSQRAGIE